MKISLTKIHHRPSPSLVELLENELVGLSAILRIDEARVRIERRLESNPPYFVSCHLVTPGPDVTAESMDHTLRAALLKVIGSLRDKIDHRHRKRARQKGNGSIRTSLNRLSGERSRG
jgi:hypothetical protein